MYKIWKFCPDFRPSGSLVASVLAFGIAVAPAQSSQAQRLAPGDSVLTEEIRDRILNDSRLPVYGIGISVVDGAVRLRGSVETLAQKRWTEDVVQSIGGVKLVDNRIAVADFPAGDAALEAVVRDQLARQSSRGSDYTRVRVSCGNGKVTLNGEVNSWGVRQQAEEFVAVVKGIRAIRNKLKVRDAVNKTDAQIEAAVLRALREKLDMTRDYTVRVRVVRGDVTLRGRVRTDREKQLALQTTLFVGGVADVADRIEVLPE